MERTDINSTFGGVSLKNIILIIVYQNIII